MKGTDITEWNRDSRLVTVAWLLGAVAVSGLGVYGVAVVIAGIADILPTGDKFWVGLVLPVLAIVISLIAIGVESWGVQHIRRVARNLDKIASEISTSFVGVFPDHLSAIETLIKRTKHNVAMMVDCIDYGSFFDPTGHRNVQAAIKDVSGRHGDERVRVRLLVCGEPKSISEISGFRGGKGRDTDYFLECSKLWFDEVRNDADFTRWLNERIGEDEPSKADRTVVRIFSYRLGLLRDGVDVNDDRAFLEQLTQCVKILHMNGPPSAWMCKEDKSLDLLLMVRQQYFLEDLRPHMEIEFLGGGGVERFLWLGDGGGEVETVYSVCEPGQIRGSGFRTRDSQMVATYQRIFEDKWKTAKEQAKEQAKVNRPDETVGSADSPA